MVNNNMTTPNIPSIIILYGCGDIYKCPGDLYLFNEALFSGKLISKESYNQMLYIRKDYGFGWYLRTQELFESRLMP